jgi:hypothetical protein
MHLLSFGKLVLVFVGLFDEFFRRIDDSTAQDVMAYEYKSRWDNSACQYMYLFIYKIIFLFIIQIYTFFNILLCKVFSIQLIVFICFRKF